MSTAERTTGARAALSRPRVYDRLQALLGAERARGRFIGEHLRSHAGDRLLDLGCGTGDLAAHLPEVRYVGVDVNPDYIEQAKERFGDRAEFHTLDVTDMDAVLPSRSFDVVTITGVIHHLDDTGARTALELAASSVAVDGRLVVLENAYFEGQNRFARWLIGRDRGLNVRLPEGYAELLREFFKHVEWVVREDLLRVPYSHVILECSGPRHDP